VSRVRDRPVVAEEHHHHPAVHQHRQQHHQAGDLEEPRGPVHAREHGEQHVEERAETAGAEECDEPPLAGLEPHAAQQRQEHHRTCTQRNGGEQQGPRVDQRESRPDQRQPERHEGEEEQHLRRRLAVLEEAVAELHVLPGHGDARGEGREESAPVQRLRGRVGGERQRERVQRLVVAPHTEARPDQLGGENAGRADRRPRDRAKDQESDRVQRHLVRRQSVAGLAPRKRQDREGHDRQEHDVVHPRLQPQRDARAHGKPPRAHQRAEEDRIRGGERRAEQRGGGERYVQQQPRSPGHDRRHDERAGAEEPPREPHSRPNLRQIESHRVAEQDEREGEGGERRERRRRQSDVRDTQSVRPEQRAEREEGGDHGQAAALHDPREQ
jgi:hypothetical protein